MNLVFVESENLNEVPFTTDEVIAEYSGNDLRSVKKLITTYKNDLEGFGILRFQITKLAGRGRPKKTYKLNEQQATLLIVYLDNTEKVRQFKKDLVKQFFAMRESLFERQLERTKAKPIRLSMTEEIKEAGFTGDWDYSNFTKLTYKTAIGISSTAIRKARKIPKGGVILDYLSVEERHAVTEREQQICVLAKLGMTYQEIKEILENQGVIYQTTLLLSGKEKELAK